MLRRIDEGAALAPRDLWPERVYNSPELLYPSELNLSVELIDRHLPARARHTAIVAPDGRLTYAELAVDVSRTSHALRQIGVGPGDRVLLRLANGTRLAAVWLAVQRLGAIAVTTWPSLRSRELRAIIDDAQPTASVVDADLADGLRRVDATALHPLRVLTAGGTCGDWAHAISLDQLARDAPLRIDPVWRPRDAVAVIVYTADAESVLPKGACYSAADLLATADTYARHVLNVTPDDVVGGPASPAFAFGLGAMLVFPLRAGATTVLSTGFDPDTLAGSIGSERLTLLFGTATSYRLLLRAPNFDHADVRSLRLAISSGEPLDAAIAVEWRRRTGMELLDGFGTTEMAHIFLSQRPGDCGSSTLGRAVPGYDVRVVDDAFVDVPVGVAGRLVVRGPTGCRYWRREDAQRRYVQHGWNVTGDWCVRDGGIRFLGRRDDLIVSAGYNISAPEIEAVLHEHPMVAEAAVVPSPDPTRGSVATALVVLRAAAAREGVELALFEHVRDALAGYKCPRRLEIVDTLPRDATGALDRAALTRHASHG
jgi:2-aminobenzoate-CoA ligase